MAALTNERIALRRDAKNGSFPVKGATKLHGGGLVAIDATGFAVKGAVSTTLKTVGVAKQTADNTTGADGAIRVSTERGCFQFENSAAGDQITLADVNAVCYIVDDQTVAKTNGTSTRSAAGTVVDVDANGVWVEV